MVLSGDGQTQQQPRSNSLRISAARQSLTGIPISSSPKGGPGGGGNGGTGHHGPPVRSSSNARISSPGALLSTVGSGGTGSPLSSSAAVTSPGYIAPTLSSDLRLPYVSESGDKNPRPPASVMLRRASTLSTMNVGRDPIHRGSGSGVAAAAAAGGEGVAESAFALKKERNALRMDKNVLLLNKRRLEGLISKVLEQPLLPGDDAAAAADVGTTTTGSSSSSMMGSSAGSGVGSMGGSGPAAGVGGPRSSLVRGGGTLRAHLVKALEESTDLDRQLASTGGGGAALQPVSAFGAATTEATDSQQANKDLMSKITQMQADHDLTVKHLESELAYRRTQSTAASVALQKQLLEAQEEVASMKQAVEEYEAQMREYHVKAADMRQQLQSVTSNLTQTTKQLADTREMLGMDKGTMATVIEMLKDQLREANNDRTAKARQITELEYAVVHRDALLTEAHDRINQVAEQAAAAAAAGVSSSAAVARVAASMHTPLDSKGSWGMRTSYTGGGVTGGSSSNAGLSHSHHSHRRLVPSTSRKANVATAAATVTMHGTANGTAAGGGGAGGAGGNGAPMTGSSGHHLSDHDSYSEEQFEAADMED